MNRRAFLRRTAGSAIAVAGGSVWYSYAIGTHDLEVTTVPLHLGLNKPLRLVALGDIHFDPKYEESYLQRVVDTISSLKADIIVYTGDFVTAHVTRIDDLAKLLSTAQSRLGSFAALGNHEHWTNAHMVAAGLEKRGIRVLRNGSFTLPDEDGVFLTGLDSFWGGSPDLKIFSQTPPTARHIVLAHEPDSFLQVNDPRVKLQISGHTHGGQVRLPLIGAVHLPIWGKHFGAGLYALDDRHLYVNRGIGTVGPALRIDCRPEITVFELA